MKAKPQKQSEADQAGQPHARRPSQEATHASPLHELHRAVGNRAVGRLAQDSPGGLVAAVLRGPGRPLDAAVRALLESRFGHDFGRVRVHTGELADASASALGAEAYTVGERIVFRQAAYAPETDAGRRLLAHELVHVLQQSGGNASPQAHAPSAVTRHGDAAEQEAEQTADAVLGGRVKGPVKVSARPPVIARQLRVPRPAGVPPDMLSRDENWEAAYVTVREIISIIKWQQVYTQSPFYWDIPERYKQLLYKWHVITFPFDVVIEGKLMPGLHGEKLQKSIGEALAETRPLLSVLTKYGDADTARWLAQDFYASVDELKVRAMSEVLPGILEEKVKAAEKTEASAFVDMIEAEALLLAIGELKLTVEELNKTARYVGTTINRLNILPLREIINPELLADINEVLNLRAAIKGAPGKMEITLNPAVAEMKAPQLFQFLKPLLDGLATVLTFKSPAARAQKFKEWRERTDALTLFSGPIIMSDVLLQIGQFVYGLAGLCGLAVYAYGSFKNLTILTTKVLSQVPRLANIQLLLNWVGLVHGLAVLLNNIWNKETFEANKNAVLETLISAIGVAAGAAPKTVGPIAGYLTVPLLVFQGAQLTFYAAQTVVQNEWERWQNWVRKSLDRRFQEMAQAVRRVDELALKLGFALEGAQQTDPVTKEAYARQVPAIKDELASTITGYVKRVTGDKGGELVNPGRDAPAINDRFRPLLDHRMNTAGETLVAAAEFVAIFIKCVADRGRILEQVEVWLDKQGAGPDDFKEIRR